MMIVVFAHVPPPLHGQSRMVELMLEGLRPGEFFHVNAQVSEDLGDVGGVHVKKVFRLLGYCIQAVRARVLLNARTLYYVPAPPKRSAILRDVLALALLRPFFPKVILHWHAAGLGAWARNNRSFGKLLSFLLREADPAIIIATGNAEDAAFFRPKRLLIVPNGIPDPCPHFDATLEPKRARVEKIREWVAGKQSMPEGGRINLLFLGHRTKAKGLFDALSGILHAAQSNRSLRWSLSLAGGFPDASEQNATEELLMSLRETGVNVQDCGFLSGEEKVRVLCGSDMLVFPSHSESFGLVAVEAIACGVSVIGTRIPGLEAVLGDTPCARVAVGDAGAIGDALLNPASYVDPRILRGRYLDEFTVERFHSNIRSALFETAPTL